MRPLRCFYSSEPQKLNFPDLTPFPSWRSIEEVVKATDETGWPLHPKLHGLWDWAATGRHAIYIEMLAPTRIHRFLAGDFHLEKCDPSGERCSAVIRLSTSVIDQSVPVSANRTGDEFVPLKGLGKLERYAEVLGHELAHARCALENSAYAVTLEELERQGREFSHFLRQKGKGKLHGQERQERIARLKSLTDRIEKPAEIAEAEIWRKLLRNQGQAKSAARPSERARRIAKKA